MTRSYFAGVLAALLILSAMPVWAASDSTLKGTVVDESGKPLRGILVTATYNDFESSVTVLTSTSGVFEIGGLNPQNYDVRARQIGLEDLTLTDIALKAGQTAGGLSFKMKTVANINDQRPAHNLFSFVKFDDPNDKQNFKMMCSYCHQVGTIGFRTPEEPVDWETMVSRMDGFGGLYKHTQDTIVSRLLDAYSDEAIENWPEYTVPEAPKGEVLNVRIEEWDMGRQDACMMHDLEVGTDGLVYVVDMINDAVVSLNPETGERKVYGVPGGKDPESDATPVKGPHSIEADADGNMWITLALSGQMAKFDTKTKEFLQVSANEAPKPRGAYPHTLRVDQKGIVWYTDAGMGVFSLDPNNNNKVTKYKLPSKDQAVGGGRGESRGITPYGIDVAPDGNIWYTKLNGNRIGRINPVTGEVKEWNPPFRGPRRLHVAPDGKVWVPGFGSGTFASFDPETEEWDVKELPDAMNRIPYALNVNPINGDVWICGTGSDSLWRYKPSTDELLEYPMPSRVTYTREIEFDAEGNVWVCNSNYPVRHTERGRGSIIKIMTGD